MDVYSSVKSKSLRNTVPRQTNSWLEHPSQGVPPKTRDHTWFPWFGVMYPCSWDESSVCENIFICENSHFIIMGPTQVSSPMRQQQGDLLLEKESQWSLCKPWCLLPGLLAFSWQRLTWSLLLSKERKMTLIKTSEGLAGTWWCFCARFSRIYLHSSKTEG